MIRPSMSHWSNLEMLVPKKDSSLRFCKWLNAITRRDVYPLAHIDDILGTLQCPCYRPMPYADLAGLEWDGSFYVLLTF